MLKNTAKPGSRAATETCSTKYSFNVYTTVVAILLNIDMWSERLQKLCCCRFYFVGDEDLLEIIGNSKNIPRLQKHFKKMFAGVAMILLNEDDTVVKGIASKEGEEVSLFVLVQ